MKKADLRDWLATTEAHHPARMVYAVLWAHTDRHCLAWPSVATIAREARLARSTVQGALRELTTLGDVIPKVSTGRATTYYLPAGRAGGVPAGRAGVPDTPTKPARWAGPKDVKDAYKDAARAQNGATAQPPGRAAVAPRNPLTQPTTTDSATHLPGSGTLRWAHEILGET